jgi:hypothetical protein
MQPRIVKALTDQHVYREKFIQLPGWLILIGFGVGIGVGCFYCGAVYAGLMPLGTSGSLSVRQSRTVVVVVIDEEKSPAFTDYDYDNDNDDEKPASPLNAKDAGASVSVDRIERRLVGVHFEDRAVVDGFLVIGYSSGYFLDRLFHHHFFLVRESDYGIRGRQHGLNFIYVDIYL